MSGRLVLVGGAQSDAWSLAASSIVAYQLSAMSRRVRVPGGAGLDQAETNVAKTNTASAPTIFAPTMPIVRRTRVRRSAPRPDSRESATDDTRQSSRRNAPVIR